MDMKKVNKDKLKALEVEQLTNKYPNLPIYAHALTDWNDNSANSLTKSIIFWINALGGQAERISVQGQYRAGKKIPMMDSFKQLPGKWTKSQGTKGSADISATINGRSVKIEVKYGKDRQSDDQKAYQEQIEKAGGIYYIAKTFDDFVLWYEKFTICLI